MKREEGVVAVVAAICLVVLMGAIALTIDVGGLFYRRREMVNGADAAALAAAMECSKGHGLAAATTAADHQFEGDSPGSKAAGYSLSSIVASPTCGGAAGHITVKYASPNPSTSPRSSERRTATPSPRKRRRLGARTARSRITRSTWGHRSAFKTCSVEAPPGTDCYYLFDNNQNGNGDFGFLNLAQWNWPSDQGCNGAGGANLISGEITQTIGYSQYVFDAPGLRVPGERAQRQGLEPGSGVHRRSDSLLPHQRPFTDDGQALVHRGVRADDHRQRRSEREVLRRPLDHVEERNVCSSDLGGVGSGPTRLEAVDLCDLSYGTDPVKGTCLG